jgi:hypothetical protein
LVGVYDGEGAYILDVYNRIKCSGVPFWEMIWLNRKGRKTVLRTFCVSKELDDVLPEED